MNEQNNIFPRPLTTREWELIEWILPEDRTGYRKYRELLRSLSVIGQGRWGEGNIILGQPGDTPELSGPMERIFANGIIEADEGKITVSVHEYAAGQLEIQITNLNDESFPDKLSIKRKVTYSTWKPGIVCPFCNGNVREVHINSSEPIAMLAFCRSDRSIWIYDDTGGVNHPIPGTNYYNELMLHKHIKDPALALESNNLFTMLDDYSDNDLRQAFVNYNKIWHRIDIRSESDSDNDEKENLTEKLSSIFKGK
jgi:hypothetical protein